MQRLYRKRIVLGVGGGIAAYKSAELIRRLLEHGAQVRVVMTRGGAEFITPLTLQALSGHPVHMDLLDPAAEAAVRRAIDTGVAQPWAEAGFEGYAVSGPSQILGHTACRNIVVWVEPSGSKGQAINSRWCLMEGAVWARQKENAPIDLLPPAFVAED